MKKLLVLLLMVLMASFIVFACSSGDDDDDDNNDSGPPDTTGFIINHACCDLSRIPTSWIDSAQQNLRIGYSHTSHGSQLITGISAISNTLGGSYNFSISWWGAETGYFMNDLWANDAGGADLGHDGDLDWRDATREMLNRSGNDRNVVMWSWCGGVSDNSSSGIQTYLNAMNALESEYPNVTFVYMTGHLDGSGNDGNLHQRNEQIRQYCRDNNKVLFDFADIESYDPDMNQNYCAMYANDNCDYDSNGDGSQDRNWAMDWYNANSSSQLGSISSYCDECAHSQHLNCVLKGVAFWWMAARIAGWDGN